MNKSKQKEFLKDLRKVLVKYGVNILSAVLNDVEYDESFPAASKFNFYMLHHSGPWGASMSQFDYRDRMPIEDRPPMFTPHNKLKKKKK